jgi:hypothetical protein
MNSILLPLALLSPPNFPYSNTEKAVFVDFTHATYTLSGGRHGFEVQTEIELDQPADGHILFDLEKSPDEMTLDGVRVTSGEIKTPDHETELKVLSAFSTAGHHRLTMTSRISDASLFKNETYFKMRDLYGNFLAQYLPTNLEYDQYAIELRLSVPSTEKFELMSNADSVVSGDENGRTLYVLQYPAYSNCSSVFFHLFGKGLYAQMKTAYTTASGRVIPITVYGKSSQNLNDYAAKAIRVMAELETDYGEYSHPSLVVYAKGSGGGMEYAGATESSLVSLDHELFHSYFGRSVMPANGNSGCLDEALASWRDYGYSKAQTPGFSSSSICGHSVYMKKTDKHSYAKGREFFAYVDFRLNGGLKKFMKEFYQSHLHQVVTIEQFAGELSRFSGIDFTADFQKYLF